MATCHTVVNVPGDLEVSGAPAECKRILAVLESPDASTLEIEILGERFTQPALQILFATLSEASQRNHAYRLGLNAGALVESRLDEVNGASL